MFEIGSSLREARLRHGSELAEAEAATKIRSKYLRALEEERFELLPAQTYVKGFLRSYAEFLGLDGQLYVDEYNSRYGADEEEVLHRAKRPQTRAHRRVESRILVLALVGIAAVTALVVVAWRWGGAADPSVPNLGTPGGQATQASTPQECGGEAGSTWIALELIGLRTGSRVTVYRGSGDGTLLFDGTIPAGHSRCFAGGRVWFQAVRPENVVAKIDGRQAPLPRGSGPLTAIASKNGIAPAGGA